MALEFEVFKHVPAGSNNSQRISTGKIDAIGFVKLNEPSGYIWFGGDMNPTVQIALDGFPEVIRTLSQYVPVSLLVPLVIGGQPLNDKPVYSINLTFKPK
jgi:hypothetical protein